MISDATGSSTTGIDEGVREGLILPLLSQIILWIDEHNTQYLYGYSRFFFHVVALCAIPFSLLRLLKIDAANQQRKLFARQLHAAIFRCWPMQPTLFHAARANPQTVSIKEKYLHPISSFVGEEK